MNYVKVKKFREIFPMSRTTFYNLVKIEDFPAIKVANNGSYLVDADDYPRWAKEQEKKRSAAK